LKGESLSHSIHFFETQFRQQVAAGALHLNPFETLALPYLRGRVLDYGCGLGNLAVAAAQGGCEVRVAGALRRLDDPGGKARDFYGDRRQVEGLRHGGCQEARGSAGLKARTFFRDRGACLCSLF